MIVLAKNTTLEDIVLSDLGGKVIPDSSIVNLGDVFSIIEIASSSDLLTNIASGTIMINNGERDLLPSDAVKYVSIHNVPYGPRDKSQKLRVHQTSRKLGLTTYWTGAGDDISNITDLGNGTPMFIKHELGDNDLETLYVDFNIIENETWLHEGYVSWKDAFGDTLTLSMVPTVVDWSTSSGTYYNAYGGYLAVPAAGNGTVQINSDLTTHSGGLVYMPDDDLGNHPTAFWNATWNSSTSVYENITPAPYGDGRYNIFLSEVNLAKFANRIVLIGDGFMMIQSSDTDRMGQGMRLKLEIDTVGEDHEWAVGCIITMHRDKTNG